MNDEVIRKLWKLFLSMTDGYACEYGSVCDYGKVLNNIPVCEIKTFIINLDPKELSNQLWELRKKHGGKVDE